MFENINGEFTVKNLTKTKWFIYGAYLLLVMATLLIGFVFLFILNAKDEQGNNTLKNVFISLFETAENRTFDFRQSIQLQLSNKHKQPNQNIVVLAIDDASVESLWEQYGEWPAPRNIYADAVNYIEQQKPKAIIFDLMFIKSLKTSEEADKYFIETLNKYDNIYTGINFDDRDFDVRKPINLPEKMSVNLNNTSNAKIINYKNCRPILQELFDSESVKIAITNVERDEDGILRKISPFVKYKDNFYPYLAFKSGVDYFLSENAKQFYIDNNRKLKVGNKNLPLTPKGERIINWYDDFDGEINTYSFYKVLNEANNITKKQSNFKDKIIFVGTTAEALYDIKSVPIEKQYPGVYVQATVFNNILDNNFIRKTGLVENIVILALLIALVGGIVMFSTSTLFATLSTILFTIAYSAISYYVMEIYNVWIPMFLPVISITFAFILSLLAKYLMKSRDFEYQYKLATIDGLTELYNHRYFQDTLRKQIDIARRYDQSVSLIICDIDFFKKFNDTYGHQTGDAVLRQVAQILKKNSRTTDYVCRYGGEEMSIILPNTNAKETLLLANRICSAVAEKPFHITPVDSASVTISLGVATFPENAQTSQDLIEWADKGLYYAKEHGRNQVGRY